MGAPAAPRHAFPPPWRRIPISSPPAIPDQSPRTIPVRKDGSFFCLENRFALKPILMAKGEQSMSFGPAWMAAYRRALPGAQTTSRKTAEPVIGNLPLRQSAAARKLHPRVRFAARCQSGRRDSGTEKQQLLSIWHRANPEASSKRLLPAIRFVSEGLFSAIAR